MSNTPEQVIILDRTHTNAHRNVQYVASLEAIEKLQATAERIGGFAVDILANPGDHYRTSYKYNDEVVVTSTMQLEDDKAIVRIVNTQSPVTPTDLTKLYRAAEPSRY